MKLAHKKCEPCEGGIPAFSAAEAKRYLRHLNAGWRLERGKLLVREFKFKNFVASMSFANAVALLAQADNHHPDMTIGYSRVRIELSTHAINGLSENDFILAAKIDQLK